MAFATEKFSRGFAFLLSQFFLLLLDPIEFGNGIEADGVDLHSRWGGYTYFAQRWIDAQMDIFDVLEHHIDGDIS